MRLARGHIDLNSGAWRPRRLWPHTDRVGELSRELAHALIAGTADIGQPGVVERKGREPLPGGD